MLLHHGRDWVDADRLQTGDAFLQHGGGRSLGGGELGEARVDGGAVGGKFPVPSGETGIKLVESLIHSVEDKLECGIHGAPSILLEACIVVVGMRRFQDAKRDIDI